MGHCWEASATNYHCECRVVAIIAMEVSEEMSFEEGLSSTINLNIIPNNCRT